MVAHIAHWRTFTMFIRCCLKGSGNLRLAVQLPDGEDLNEWLAVHGAFTFSSALESSPYNL